LNLRDELAFFDDSDMTAKAFNDFPKREK